MMFFIICLIVGACVGFLAGLFGIGGGLVIVPALVYLLPKIGTPDEYLMSMALGTSFATIVITSFSSAQRHHKLGNIVWSAIKYLAPSIVIAVFIAGQFVSKLPKDIAAKIFACMVVYLAVKMVVSIKTDTGTKPLTPTVTILGGLIIGAISSVAGIGGGGFIVPFLNARGISMKKAIGSSAFCGMLLGLSGCVSFALSGFQLTNLPEYSFGFIYLPAVVGITLTSFFTSKIGANLTNVLPVPILKKGFALLLCCIAIKMFIS